MNKLGKILNISDDSDIGYFLEVDLRHPDNKKGKTKVLSFYFVKKVFFLKILIIIICKRENLEYIQKLKKAEKLLCEKTDKTKFLIQYRMLKFYVRHGLVDDKVHEIISFTPRKWLEKYTKFNSQKRNDSKIGFDKDFHKLLNNEFYAKTMENVRNRLRSEFIKR